MPPNIIVVLFDAARARNFSAYGYDRETTPFISSLTESGIRYERAVSNSIYSLPSYASIFTGQYPTEHGAISWSDSVTSNPLVEGLKNRGYTTYAVSTHLLSGEFGLSDAFDEIDIRFLGSNERLFEDDPVADAMSEKGTRDGWDSELEKYWYFLSQFAKHPSPRTAVNGAYKFYRKFQKDYGFWMDDGAADAFSTAREAIAEASEPFFLFLNLVETHDPYRPPRSYIRRFMPDDITFDEIRAALEYSSVRASLDFQTIDDREREILVALYDAEIRYLDDKLRDFHAHLEDVGVAEDTVFVVLADHGDYFGEHGLWGHQGEIHTEVVHVPLVISAPWADGDVVEDVVELRQLCPYLQTIADGDQTEIRPTGEAIVEYYGLDTQLSYVPSEEFEDISADDWECYQCAVLDRSYACRFDSTNHTELYKLENNFQEHTGISDEHQDLAISYRDRAIEAVGDPTENHRRYRAVKNDLDLDDAVEDRLSELGYVE